MPCHQTKKIRNIRFGKWKLFSTIGNEKILVYHSKYGKKIEIDLLLSLLFLKNYTRKFMLLQKICNI